MGATKSRGPGSPSSASRTVIGRLQDLVARNTEGDLELLSRFASLLREAGRRPSSRGTDGRELAERGAELLLDWYTTMSRHRLAFLHESLSALERSLGVAAGAPPADAGTGASAAPTEVPTEPGDVAALTVSARPGDTAAARFLLENHYPYAMTLAFEVEPAGDSTGEEATPDDLELPADWVSFHPDPLRLEPRSKAVVEVRVAVPKELDPSLRDREASLRTSIRLHGLEARRLLLTLHLLAPAAEAKARKPKKPSQAEKPTKSKEPGTKATSTARKSPRKSPRKSAQGGAKKQGSARSTAKGSKGQGGDG